MKIAGHEISSPQPPYLIAEASCNHGGSLGLALQLIRAAKNAGANAVKFQCYEPDTITMDARNNPEFIIKGGPWHGRHFYDLYTETHTPFSWFPSLFKYAKETDITAFASVFDKTSVDLLETLDCPAYKIASMEIVDLPLIEYAARTGKPLIISTGMAADEEIFEARGRCDLLNTVFLHCVSGYPTPIEEADLPSFRILNGQYPYAGISDHTLGWEIPVAATALGAAMIEKHLTLSREYETEDRDFSMTPAEFRLMADKVCEIWQAMQPSEAKSEETSRQARRSLYVVENIRGGEMFTAENVRSIRPAYGLPPKNLPKVLGCKAVRDIEAGTALSWDLVEQASSSRAAQDLPAAS